MAAGNLLQQEFKCKMYLHSSFSWKTFGTDSYSYLVQRTGSASQASRLRGSGHRAMEHSQQADSDSRGGGGGMEGRGQNTLLIFSLAKTLLLTEPKVDWPSLAGGSWDSRMATATRGEECSKGGLGVLHAAT